MAAVVCCMYFDDGSVLTKRVFCGLCGVCVWEMGLFEWVCLVVKNNFCPQPTVLQSAGSSLLLNCCLMYC